MREKALERFPAYHLCEEFCLLWKPQAKILESHEIFNRKVRLARSISHTLTTRILTVPQRETPDKSKERCQ